MGVFLILYFVIIFVLLILSLKFINKYGKYIFGKYFFLGLLFHIIWLGLYIVSFSISIENKDILLYLSRFMYGLSLLAMYSILFFIIFFNEKKVKNYRIHIFIISGLISLLFVSAFTPLIISEILLDETLLIYYESFGIGFNLYYRLYLLYPFLIILFFYKKLKKLNTINKIRFKILVLGYILFEFSEILFLGILPSFGIWFLEKEHILFFIPFIISLYLVIYKYHFSNLKIGLGKILIFIFSLIAGFSFDFLIKTFYFGVNNTITGFWGISNKFGFFDFSFGIIIFLLLYFYFNKIFLGNNSMTIFEKKLSDLKKYIPYVSDIGELNILLQNKFNKLFKLNYFNIKIFDKKDEGTQLYKYFSKDISRDIFINDIVFIEENKYKFDLKLLKKEINNKSYLIFPLINNKRKLIGLLKLGHKPFGDQYYTEEINILKDFSSYLVGHLKYIEIYSDINELNINLDKKVDEKTIEYNNLLSKQKEFISMSSHEIKTPVSSSIFQIDCLIDDINNGEIGEKKIKKDLSILNNQLLKLGDLVNKIFKVQEYDIKRIELFIEKISLENLLLNEIEVFKKVNKKLKINLLFDEKIGFIEIDKVQFKQVIDNLLNNAIKFSKQINQIINIKAKLDNNEVIISIEDNGKGFNNIDIKTIFDKYISGNISTVGIGMGLYLCKRIVEMHNGQIKAQYGDELGGAKFIIKIPINHGGN